MKPPCSSGSRPTLIHQPKMPSRRQRFTESLCRRRWLILTFLAISMITFEIYGRPFNPKVWAAAGHQGTESGRCAMENDLVYRVLKPGMSLSQVKRLLGEPDWHAADGQSLGYEVGECDVMYFDSIEIRFDRAGQLKSVSINTRR